MSTNLKNVFFEVLSLYLLIVPLKVIANGEYCDANSKCSKNARYLLYDINPPEGFNLRRDVYMRMAVLAHRMQKSKYLNLNDFKLVLPPWSHLVHWQYRKEPEHIPWSLYFDLNSLKKFAPVVEIDEFFQDSSNKYLSRVIIDEVYILQHFEDMFETGNFEDRMKIEKCQRPYQLNYFYYNNITSKNVQCLSYHGSASKLQALFLNTSAKVVLLHHSEVALHEMFGDILYWQARRSMRFNENLMDIAHEFRRKYLDSSNKKDEINLPADWRDETPRRNAKGGPYLSVHLRRQDFLRGRADQVPSLSEVTNQILKLLKKIDLETVFIATDAQQNEFIEIYEQLQKHNYKVFRFQPTDEFLNRYKDGGVAIVDQIICSYARHFIGTQESTFSFRIQEEREILGFPVNTTFNSLCKNATHCTKPSVWKIVY